MSLGNDNLDGTSAGKVNIGTDGIKPPASIVVTDGLISYYQFETSGTITADSIGTSTLTNNGATWADDATRGGVSVYDGSTSEMTGMAVQDPDLCSYSFWFNTNAFSKVILGYSVQDQSYIFIENSTNIRLRLSNADGTLSTSYTFSIPALSINTWYNLVATIGDGGSDNVKVYLNSVESTTGTLVKTPARGLRIDKIGYNSASFLPDGELDNVRVYDRALTATEVTTIYNSELL